MVEPCALINGWRDSRFEPFRDGIEISMLIEGEPSVALLRYAPGARVPHHLHPGLETVYVIEGSQSDERGTYGPGSIVLNTPGSTHSVWSDEGCVVLIQWAKPIQFIDAA